MMLELVERSLISIKHCIQHSRFFCSKVLTTVMHSFGHHTFNSVALRFSVSMLIVYSLHLFRAMQRPFKLQNGEQAKS